MCRECSFHRELALDLRNQRTINACTLSHRAQQPPQSTMVRLTDGSEKTAFPHRAWRGLPGRQEFIEVEKIPETMPQPPQPSARLLPRHTCASRAWQDTADGGKRLVASDYCAIKSSDIAKESFRKYSKSKLPARHLWRNCRTRPPKCSLLFHGLSKQCTRHLIGYWSSRLIRHLAAFCRIFRQEGYDVQETREFVLELDLKLSVGLPKRLHHCGIHILNTNLPWNACCVVAICNVH